MDNLGKYLKELREDKGLSQTDVFNKARIREEVLEKIEQNKLSDLGNYGFVKALVYNYARFLDADLDKVMTEFNVIMPPSIKKDFNPRRNITSNKIMLSTNFFWSLVILVIILVLGSILLNAYRNGWLKNPELFSKDKPVKEKVVKEKPEEEPEEIRQRMLELTKKKADTELDSTAKKKGNVDSDNADYLGTILGDSPINISID
ncbi:MAG: helix-turn-helix domain-containing protein [Candidatus Cloacimonetes bacterium]|jgi:cytoskeletal protein RodZ|nr:helix-turn-helix domain-containing protein [Candidatus Cloacimonadota bacterium]NLO43443.1 helix-turn-helix domain-containing protein [Candidatus Cloacimonadota bacterium]